MEVKIRFVDFFSDFDQENNGIFILLSKFFNLKISNDPDFIFYSIWGTNHLDYSCIRVFLTGENVRPNFLLCDYAVGFDFLDRSNYLRLPLYVYWKDFNHQDLLYPKYHQIIQEHRKSKFCCFLVSNSKSRKRIDFFEKLSSYRKVDSGGRVENNLGYSVQNKIEFMSPYKFMIAYENSSFPGYVTEKIYECFFTNTIPIYWGSPLIEMDFNPARILNRHDFDSDEKLIEKILFLDQNDDAYDLFIQQPIFRDNIPSESFDATRIERFFQKVFNGPRKTSKQGLTQLLGIIERKRRNFFSKYFLKSFR